MHEPLWSFRTLCWESGDVSCPERVRCGGRMQGMAKIKEMEQVMVDYYRDHLDEAGVGLEILPGVKDLLEALKVIAPSYLSGEVADCKQSMCHNICSIRPSWSCSCGVLQDLAQNTSLRNSYTYWGMFSKNL